MEVTLFKNITAIGEPHIADATKVLEYIKTGRWKKEVDLVRSSDVVNRNSAKKNLPCICWAGKFDIPVEVQDDKGTHLSCRTDESLSKHSNLVPFDIDQSDDMERTRELLISKPYVYALWKSPSGRGIHGLIKVSDGNRHREHYEALLNLYPFFDSKCKNESRVLYASYDPDLYINPKASVFIDVAEDKALQVSSPIITGDGLTDYTKLGVACKIVRLSPDGDRHNSLLKAAVLLGGYVSVGKMESDIAEEMLLREFTRRSYDKSYNPLKTIKDGIHHGMNRPINETEKDFYEIKAEVGSLEDELSFLSNAAKDDEWIRKWRAGLIPMGKSFGYSDMDKYLLLKEGALYCFLAHANIGKTSVTLWLIFLSAYLHGWVWMIWAAENTVPSLKIKLMEHFVGMRVRDMTDMQFKTAKRFVDDFFFFVDNADSYTPSQLLSFGKSLIKYKAIKGIFIDPYNMQASPFGMNKHDFNIKTSTDYLLFTKKNNITLFVSMHTNTEAQRARDKDGNQVKPHASQAEGGSVFYNRADYFVSLHREIKNPVRWMLTEVHVDKVREKETGGMPTPNGDPLILRMNNGVEFVDLANTLPIDRSIYF